MSIGEHLIEHLNLSPEDLGVIQHPPEDPETWRERAAALEKPSEDRVRRLHAALSFLVYLEQTGGDFPEAMDEALVEIFYLIAWHLLPPLAPHMLALFEHLPETRQARLKRELILCGLRRSLTNPDQTQDICAAFRDEARDMLAEHLQAIEVSEPKGAPRIQLPGRQHPSLASQALNIWKTLHGEAPIPAWVLTLVEQEARHRFSMSYASDLNLVEPFTWLPEARRVELALEATGIKWVLIDTCESLELALWTLDKLDEIHRRNNYGAQLKSPKTSRLPWVQACIERIEGAEGYFRNLLEAQLIYRATLDDLPHLLPLMASGDESLRGVCLQILHVQHPERLLPALQSAWSDASPELKGCLARVLAHLGLHHGLIEPIEALLAVEADPRGRLALEAALERARIDWKKAVGDMGAWLDGASTSQNQVRQEELHAILEVCRRLPSEGRWEPESFVLRHGYEPMALLVALEKTSAGTQRSFNRTLKALKVSLGGLYPTIAGALIEQRPFKPLSALYELANEQGHLQTRHHLRAARFATGVTQRLAGRALAGLGESALPGIIELLSERKGGVRAVAATALHNIKSPQALGALQAALAKERSAKVKAVLEEAIEACDPVKAALKAERTGPVGTYRQGEALEPNEGLGQLRALLYEPATEVSWVRLCDLLQRFRHAGALEAALDYLEGHGIARWPDEMRPIPWGWQAEPRLSALGHTPTERWWVPISVLHTPAGETFLDEGLVSLERRAKKRQLPRDLVEDFIGLIDKAWVWCVTHGVALDKLEARLDGGAYKGVSRPGSTSLELWRHYGLRLTRGPAFSGRTAGEGIRWIRVQLESDDPLRDAFGAKIGAPHMDLVSILDAE